MENPQMVSLWQSYCNNTKGGVYWTILYFLLSNPGLTPLQRRPFPLAKMPKNTRF